MDGFERRSYGSTGKVLTIQINTLQYTCSMYAIICTRVMNFKVDVPRTFNKGINPGWSLNCY